MKKLSLALPTKALGLANKAMRNAPAIGAAAGAISGAASKDENGNYGGVSGALRGAAVGGLAGVGAKALRGQARTSGLFNKGKPSTPTTPTAPVIKQAPLLQGAPAPAATAGGAKLAFVVGFEKTAGFGSAIGAVRGFGKNITRGISKTVGGALQRGKEEAIHAERSVMGKPAVGQGAANAAIKREQAQTGSRLTASRAEEISKGKQQEVLQRQKNIAGIREQKKPGFISKHPILSAVGAYGGYKALTSEPQQQQPPQVLQPQY